MPNAYQPLNPDWQARVAQIFAAQGFMSYLGISLSKIAPGLIEMEVPYRPALTQQSGYFHGGMMGTLVDNSGGCASATLMPAGMDVLAVEYKINLLRPGLGDKLMVRAEVIRPGKLLCVCRSDVFALKGGHKTLCATGQGTYVYVNAPES